MPAVRRGIGPYAGERGAMNKLKALESQAETERRRKILADYFKARFRDLQPAEYGDETIRAYLSHVRAHRGRIMDIRQQLEAGIPRLLAKHDYGDARDAATELWCIIREAKLLTKHQIETLFAEQQAAA